MLTLYNVRSDCMQTHRTYELEDNDSMEESTPATRVCASFTIVMCLCTSK
jgi:hypothetical protein